MFGILTLPFRIAFTAIAIYGMAHIPISGKPVWKHARAYVQETTGQVTKYVNKKKKKLRESQLQWMDRVKAEKEVSEKVSRAKKKGVRKKRIAKPKEHIKASEEKMLEKILETHI